jgi:hypothetical protein
VKPAAPRKLGLRPTPRFAVFAEAVPDFPEEVFVVEGHWRLTPMLTSERLL